MVAPFASGTLIRLVSLTKLLQRVGGTAHAQASAIQYVRVNHGSRDVAMAEQLLHGANIVARLQQVGRKRVAERMTAGGLRNARGSHGLLERALHDGLVQM